SEWGVQDDDAGPYIQAMANWMNEHGVLMDNYWQTDLAGFNGDLAEHPAIADAYRNAFNNDGGTGTDTVSGGTGTDTIDGGTGTDTVSGGTGTDTVSGGTGTDTVSGGTGTDTVSGGTGTDTVSGGTGTDTVSGGTGTDTVSGGTGTNGLEPPAVTGSEQDVVTGSAGDNGQGADDGHHCGMAGMGARALHVQQIAEIIAMITGQSGGGECGSGAEDSLGGLRRQLAGLGSEQNDGGRGRGHHTNDLAQACADQSQSSDNGSGVPTLTAAEADTFDPLARIMAHQDYHHAA
ncbi:MAG: calcium-binding protein, partial [Hyphomicrobiaceae bacterium]